MIMEAARRSSLVEIDSGNNVSLAGIVHAVRKFSRLPRILLCQRSVGSGNGAQVLQIVLAEQAMSFTGQKLW